MIVVVPLVVLLLGGLAAAQEASLIDILKAKGGLSQEEG